MVHADPYTQAPSTRRSDGRWGGVNSDVTYNAFRNNYLGAGTWTHTYRTQS
jgi:hypothetical protein